MSLRTLKFRGVVVKISEVGLSSLGSKCYVLAKETVEKDCPLCDGCDGNDEEDFCETCCGDGKIYDYVKDFSVHQDSIVGFYIRSDQEIRVMIINKDWLLPDTESVSMNDVFLTMEEAQLECDRRNKI